MKQYRVKKSVLEQAERMANKWEARAQAFYQGWEPGEGGIATVGYCKTEDEAESCQRQAEIIRNTLLEVTGPVFAPVASWNVIAILSNAAVERDILDANLHK
jgi:hypothetical protein